MTELLSWLLEEQDPGVRYLAQGTPPNTNPVSGRLSCWRNWGQGRKKMLA